MERFRQSGQPSRELKFAPNGEYDPASRRCDDHALKRSGPTHRIGVCKGTYLVASARISAMKTRARRAFVWRMIPMIIIVR